MLHPTCCSLKPRALLLLAWRQELEVALDRCTLLGGKVQAYESFSEEATQKIVVSAWHLGMHARTSGWCMLLCGTAPSPHVPPCASTLPVQTAARAVACAVVQDLELELSEEHAQRMSLELHGQEQLDAERVGSMNACIHACMQGAWNAEPVSCSHVAVCMDTLAQAHPGACHCIAACAS